MHNKELACGTNNEKGGGPGRCGNPGRTWSQRQKDWRDHTNQSRDVGTKMVKKNKHINLAVCLKFFIKSIYTKTGQNSYDRTYYWNALNSHTVPYLQLDLLWKLWSVPIIWMEFFSIWRAEWVCIWRKWGFLTYLLFVAKYCIHGIKFILYLVEGCQVCSWESKGFFLKRNFVSSLWNLDLFAYK